MVASLGTDRVEELHGQMVPRGATVGALATAWSREIGELEGSLHRVSGMTEAEAGESLILTVSRLAKVEHVRHSMLAELRSAREVVVWDAIPPPVDVNATLGVRRRSVGEENEKEPPVTPNVRQTRSRSPSYDKHRHRHY